VNVLTRSFKKLQNKWPNAKLPIALTGAVLIAIIMTAISVSVYQQSGVSKLDLSRPGYENARKQVDTKKPIKTYNSSGPINPDTIEEFLSLLRTQNKELKNASDFGDQNLDDASLELNP
jgi:hypothetical protein